MCHKMSFTCQCKSWQVGIRFIKYIFINKVHVTHFQNQIILTCHKVSRIFRLQCQYCDHANVSCHCEWEKNTNWQNYSLAIIYSSDVVICISTCVVEVCNCTNICRCDMIIKKNLPKSKKVGIHKLTIHVLQITYIYIKNGSPSWLLWSNCNLCAISFFLYEPLGSDTDIDRM